jgi:cytochrome c
LRRAVVTLALVLALAVLSLALGLVHPFGNPRAATTVATDAPATILMEHALIPVEVRSVLREKCADCHSTQTHWPWYGRFAPVSWLLEYDITASQKELNLSQWESLPDEDILRLRVEIAGVTRAHMMPPLRYRLVHRGAEITDGDIRVLRNWARADLTSDLDEPQKTPPDQGPGDPSRGHLVFASRCGGCHTLDQNREGPKLGGVVGRVSGTAPGFLYSAALKKAAVKWDAHSLDEWLTNPAARVPMNNMYFHVAKPQQRSDLIAYLQTTRAN